MVAFSPIDLQLFVIRLVVFFLVLGVLMGMFVALGEIGRGSTTDRKLNELGEAMLSSDFATAFATFDPQKSVRIDLPGLKSLSMTDLNGGNVEPLRFCEYFAEFEFFTSGSTLAYSFGGRGGNELAKRDWQVWIKTGGDIIPATMRITLYSSRASPPITEPLQELFCAIEMARASKAPVEMNSAIVCPADIDCKLTYDNNSGVLTLAQNLGFGEAVFGVEGTIYASRYFGIDVKSDTLSHGERDVTIYPVPKVQNANYNCPSPTTFLTDVDRSKDVDRVVICDVTK